jgi:hypothetical protein
MDIEYFNLVKYSKVLGRYALETPSHVYENLILEEYIVKEHEEMRFDLIIESMYETKLYYEYLDIILYINNIDNPLNVMSGQKILYPPKESLDSYRITIEDTEILGENKSINGNHSKVNRVDKNRADFINSNYTLNPVQSIDNKTSVDLINDRVDGASVVVYGINSN